MQIRATTWGTHPRTCCRHTSGSIGCVLWFRTRYDTIQTSAWISKGSNQVKWPRCAPFLLLRLVLFGSCESERTYLHSTNIVGASFNYLSVYVCFVTCFILIHMLILLVLHRHLEGLGSYLGLDCNADEPSLPGGLY